MEDIEGLAQIVVILVISLGARKAILQRLCNAIKSRHNERYMGVKEFLTKCLFSLNEIMCCPCLSYIIHATLISSRSACNSVNHIA